MAETNSWSELSTDLLDLIWKGLQFHIDHVRFKAVCKSWRSRDMRRERTCQIPWLMLPSNTGFVGMYENCTYHFQCPEIVGRRCVGSSQGWLALVSEAPKIDVFLFNPLTKILISLPPLTKFPEILRVEETKCEFRDSREFIFSVDQIILRNFFTFHKFYLTSTPNSGNCYAVLSYRFNYEYERVAFAKLEDLSWTPIEDEVDKCRRYSAIIYHRDLLYMADETGRLICSDLNFSKNSTVIPPPVEFDVGPKYLVQVCDELVLIDRHGNIPKTDTESLYLDTLQTTYLNEEVGPKFVRRVGQVVGGGDTREIEYCFDAYRFIAFKLDPVEKSWLEVKNLADHTLFVNSHCSTSLLVSDYPFLKANLIYYLDDFMVRGKGGIKTGHEVRTYNLKDQTIESLLSLVHTTPFTWMRCAWFTPSCKDESGDLPNARSVEVPSIGRQSSNESVGAARDVSTQGTAETLDKPKAERLHWPSLAFKEDMGGQLVNEFSEESGDLPELQSVEEVYPIVHQLSNKTVGAVRDVCTQVKAVTLAKPKYRHDYFQEADKVVLTIYSRGIPTTSAVVDFGEQILSVSIDVPGEDMYHFQPRLFQKIIPSKCKYEVLPAKVEIHLAKAERLYWPSLEFTEDIGGQLANEFSGLQMEVGD